MHQLAEVKHVFTRINFHNMIEARLKENKMPAHEDTRESQFHTQKH